MNNEIVKQNPKFDYAFVKNNFKLNSGSEKDIISDDSITVGMVTEYNRLCYEVANMTSSVSDFIKQIAICIAVINDKQLFKVGGFNDIYSFAFDCFGYSRRSVSRFLDVVYFFCTKVDDDYVFLDYFKDFSIHKLDELVNIDIDKLVGVVTPDMSVRKIKSIASQIHKDNSDIVSDSANNSDNNNIPGSVPDEPVRQNNELCVDSVQIDLDFDFKIEKHDNGDTFYEYNSVRRKGKKECTNVKEFDSDIVKLLHKNIDIGKYKIIVQRL